MRQRSDGFVLHGTMVNAHDGRQADGSAGKEQFVANVEFAAVDRSLDDAQPEFAICESP